MKESKLMIKNKKNLAFSFLGNGLIRSIETPSVCISLKKKSNLTKFGANIYLRKKTDKNYQFLPLLGPQSNSVFSIDNNIFRAKGKFDGISYECILQLSKTGTDWKWTVNTKNTTKEKVNLDLVYVQDIGLQQKTNGTINQLYVSQYVERLVLNDGTYGKVVCCRQNLKNNPQTPWLQIFCKNAAKSVATDGMQFYGKSFRETNVPESLLLDELGGEYAGESSIIALQETPFCLKKDDSYESCFIGNFVSNHPDATSEKDLKSLDGLLNNFDDEIIKTRSNNYYKPEINIFNSASLFPTDKLKNHEIDKYFSKKKRHAERKDGNLLSFFYDKNFHVALKDKEILTDRPHGNILLTKNNYTPDENIVTTSVFACGIFNSQITQGNTNFNGFLSINTEQFDLETYSGQRIFVEIDNQYHLLGIPSAFEMGINHSRWIYKYQNKCFQIRTWTSMDRPQINMDFKVLEGKGVNVLITNNLEEQNNWITKKRSDCEYIVKAKSGSKLTKIFPDAQFRILIQNKYSNHKVCLDRTFDKKHNFINFEVKDATNFCLSFMGEIAEKSNFITIKDADKQWREDIDKAQKNWNRLSSDLELKGSHQDMTVIQEILPWYGANALVHLLTPHGLEQFNGAAWGTRDVTQGPFELLLKTEKYVEIKQILRIVFSNQNSDGKWPQWWMFDSYSKIRAEDAHSDIHHWCLIAFGNYIKATGDIEFLREEIPYFDSPNDAKKTKLIEHAERLIDAIINSFIPNTAFVPYGGGDWNDSMRPVSDMFAKKLVSSWTVALNYQSFSIFSDVYHLIGETKKAKRLENICAKIKTDFNRYLIKDKAVAGYGFMNKNNTFSLLLHPDDSKTNIQYRLLPMIRGIISGIFSKDQAQYHQNLIKKHLTGPDGARLMNRPLRYNGGVQKIFRRAESSPYFGREIGLMYTHAHLRYIESLAIMGYAELLIKSLRQANPIDYNAIVSCADMRQSNCYYSSSDAIFKNRYETNKKYEDLIKGEMTLKGGWRIYSSGAGIYIGLIISHLLGIRSEFNKIILDPVIPKALDGLSISIKYKNYPLTINYHIKEDDYHPKKIFINGKSIRFDYEQNQYRKGGSVIMLNNFLKLMNKQDNKIDVWL